MPQIVGGKNMKCKEIEPLIYLFKPKELTADEQHQLDEHLKSCSDCRKLVEELNTQNLILSEISSKNFNSTQSSYYKQQIFNEIDNFEKNQNRNISQKTLRNYLNYFSMPAYRYISAALIAGLVITFLFQNYLAYLSIGKLEMRFGNPSSYMAKEEIKPIVFGKEDFNFLKESSQKGLKTGRIHKEASWFKGNQFLLLSMRKHRFFQELANHNPAIDPANFLRIYNKSVYIGTSGSNQN
jgi:hypothetical protein